MNDIEDQNKIITAAYWKSETENYGFGDGAYRAFADVMKYRREIAKQYLQEPNEDRKLHIKVLLDECNKRIKQILGL